jgi:predicted  nucleic acid-binding Zn-ribbon protein
MLCPSCGEWFEAYGWQDEDWEECPYCGENFREYSEEELEDEDEDENEQDWMFLDD